MNETLLNKARLNVVSLNKALINGAVERHGSSAGGGGAPSKYIRFADPAVEAVLMANGVSSDGVGITKEDAAKVTNISSWFNGNTTITSFDELRYFVGLANLGNRTNSNNAFTGCTSLESVVLPPQIKRLYYETFSGATALRSVGNIEQLEIIDENVFAKTSLSGEINLPLLTTIKRGAFSSTLIKKVSLGNITDLGGYANNYNTKGYGVFANCTELEEVILPEGLLGICDYCFYACSSLRKVNLPETIISLKASAFYNSSLLTFDEVNLPNLTIFGRSAFHGIGGIKKVSSLGTISEIPNSDVNYQSYQLFGNKEMCEEVVLPETLQKIGYYNFFDYQKMRVNLPKSLTYIDVGNFVNNSMDVDVDLPNLETLSNWVFSNTRIKKVVDLGKITKLSSAYNRLTLCNNAELESVALPNTLTEMAGGYILRDCPKLTTLICQSTTPPTLSSGCLNNTPIASGTGIIYVPDAALEVYKTATNWSAYADRIHPLSELEGSPYITFADPEVERVLMENNVSSDGVGITMADAEAVTSNMQGWFNNNASVTSFNELQYFTGITQLGLFNLNATYAGAFYKCTALTEVTIPANVTLIGEYCFCDSSSLANVTFADSSKITYIGIGAFRNTKIAGEISFPNVETIKGVAFANTNITKVLSLGKMTRIEGVSSGYASALFDGCASLAFIELPSTLTDIVGFAIGRCAALTTIVCRATTPPNLSSQGFSGCNALTSIYVPDASVDTYKAATNWSTHASRIKPLSEYVES